MKVVISALRMSAFYMRFNVTGIWGGETIVFSIFSPLSPPPRMYPQFSFD